MGFIAMNGSDVDFSDVQGLLRFGYGGMEKARYELVRIRDINAAREWLKAAEFNNAAALEPAPDTALQIAFTASGLRQLKVPDAVVNAFSHEFRTGMAAEYRSRQLGDIGPDAPSNWWWGTSEEEPQLMVMFYGKEANFASFVASSKGSRWDTAFQPLTRGTLETSDLDGIEPFGFADGISQPDIDWKQGLETTHASMEYRNKAALGEFLLGYPNEYGKITDRPLLEPAAGSSGLPDALDTPGMKDLGRNGTYLVMRQLEQDVRAFWTSVYQNSGGDHDAAEKLAAAMVGRTRDGTPLAGTGRGKDKKDFTFDEDANGSRCPFGAHIRRANPRNADFGTRPPNLFQKLATMLGFGPSGFRDDLMSSVRFHRILRRGREYGPGLKPEDAISGGGSDEPRGIHFICLNANISRQFEFIQNAWLAGTKFSGLTGESDPLVGNRQPLSGCPVTANFTLQSECGLQRRVSGLPRFVTVRGGAYFFMPGLSALRHIAAAGEED